MKRKPYKKKIKSHKERKEADQAKYELQEYEHRHVSYISMYLPVKPRKQPNPDHFSQFFDMTGKGKTCTAESV